MKKDYKRYIMQLFSSDDAIFKIKNKQTLFLLMKTKKKHPQK